MNNYKYFITNNNLKVKRITFNKNQVIIDTPLDSYIIIKGDINKYNYLMSRGFDYIPKIIDYDNNNIMIYNNKQINYNKEEKVSDFIRVISLLHIKTTFQKEINDSDYKFIYESTYKKLIDINNYYENLITNIENKEYMSPIEYLVARNISNIFYIINSCFNLLEEYYSLVKDKKNIRVVTLFNNNIDNMIKTKDHIYLIDFNNSNIDMPIYDLLNIYKEYSVDLNTILNIYNRIFKLNNEEILLLKILIMIPDKIIIDNKINGIKKSKTIIKEIYKSIDILKSNKEETSKTKEQENNK